MTILVRELRAEIEQLKAENERLASEARLARAWADMTVHKEVGRAVTEALAYRMERDQLKAENAELRAQAGLQILLPELDDALEHLEMHGLHSDQGYRKLKDWYRKVSIACKAIDQAMTKEQP